jgi:hypothetical protein
MQNRYFAAIIIVIVVVLFVAGLFLADQQIDVNGCAAKWRTVSVTVQHSELCSAAACAASPDKQQHNAIVSALLCACSKASSQQYSDAAANKRIEDVVKNFFGYTLTAQEMCDQPGLFLTKRSYD